MGSADPMAFWRCPPDEETVPKSGASGSRGCYRSVLWRTAPDWSQLPHSIPHWDLLSRLRNDPGMDLPPAGKSFCRCILSSAAVYHGTGCNRCFLSEQDPQTNIYHPDMGVYPAVSCSVSVSYAVFKQRCSGFLPEKRRPVQGDTSIAQMKICREAQLRGKSFAYYFSIGTYYP